MKLVEILARELKVWPEDVNKLLQSFSGRIFYIDSAAQVVELIRVDIAIDWIGTGVTRADWEAGRAKLKAPKANGDGWVRNRGRSDKPPVADDVMVQVVLRDESKNSFDEKPHPAKNWVWRHRASYSDLMWYRIHKPAEQSAPVSEPESELLYDPVAQGPLQWRDRIRELDTQHAEVEATYQRQISEITQERESLVQKLAGEGLALVEVVVKPVEDMSDWRNWKAGDLLTLVGGHISDTDFTLGNQYKFLLVDEWDEIIVIDDAGDENGYGVNSGVFKWHSRPTS
jgi:hypothetical protein